MSRDDFAGRLQKDIFDEAIKEIGEIIVIVERNLDLVRPEFRPELEKITRKELKDEILHVLRKLKHDQLLRGYNLKNSIIN